MSSHSEEPNGANLQFEWGIKRSVGGTKQNAQFYGSFTFDGEKYSLSDCVYLFKKGDPQPYIGKIIKIWEQDERKKVKILWFFQPDEIKNYLGDHTPLEKEIFIASGEGVGLANINPLEAIAGKCSVICTSEDERNPQPSKEALEMADYIFYRTFDVGTYTISDKIPDKIAQTEVKLIFNQKEDQQPNSSRPEANGFDGEGKADVSNPEPRNLSISDSLKSPENKVRTDETGHEVEKEHPNQVKHPAENNVPESKTSFLNDVGKASKSAAGHVEGVNNSAKNKASSDICDDKPSKKMRFCDQSVKQLDDSEKKKKNATGVRKVKIGSSDDDDDDDHRDVPSVPLNKESSENLKLLDGSQKKKNATGVRKVKIGSDDDDDHRDVPSVPLNKESSENLKLSDKKGKKSLQKASPAVSVQMDTKVEHQTLEVARKPDEARRKWFNPIPWGSRLKNAEDQGNLVFLQNFDRRLTSADIEGIIEDTFHHKCSAKVVPVTPIHNPHHGQAYVIFKSRDEADQVVQKINTGCLMLPSGRAFIASKGLLKIPIPGKATKFPGHLSIDRIKQMQREDTRKAVSTSHCSQPNTIEYEMAMDWILAQEKSASCFDKLFKEHHNELKQATKNLKAKV